MINIQDFLKNRLLNTKETAYYLNYSVNYVRKLSSIGKLSSYKPGGKNLYFDIEDLDDYLRSYKRMSEEEVMINALKYNLKK